MNWHGIDWIIIWGFLAFLTLMAMSTRKYTKSVADFLSANRCAGRYLICISDFMAGVSAIGIIAHFEVYYKSGFTPLWWMKMSMPVGLIIALTGWVIYRFRETRALTLAQFFEIRYSRRFRVFAGMLSFVSGVINFGVFPAVGARFFINFCGLPETVNIFGIAASTFVLIIVALVSVALFFTFLGGQITVIVTDFFQGIFCNIVFMIILVFLLSKFDWSSIFSTLATAPKEQSMIHPLHTSKLDDFNMWFYLIITFRIFYNTLSWQGQSGYNCSALNAHEAKMAKVLSNWRSMIAAVFTVMLPICALTLLKHPDFAETAQLVTAKLDVISAASNDTSRIQLTTPIVLAHILPTGLLGAFAAMMLAAFISTHDTYLHSWGSIFIQDVVSPLRKKPFTQKQHMRLLRFSILGVGAFIIIWSSLFTLKEHILMYFAITGAIFMGGAGSAIIGGLYWKRGTTAAAWCSMITGSVLATTAICLSQLWPIYHNGTKFPINGMVMTFVAMVVPILTYILVSLLGERSIFNMNRMLHRGEYAIENEHIDVVANVPKLWKLLGVTKEFTRGDKAIFLGVTIWSIGWFLIFVIGTIYNIVNDVPDESWARFWKLYIWLFLGIGVATTIWFAIFGFRDLGRMYKTLRTVKRDSHDDGTVDLPSKS
ncbi:MAG: hypothetical protein K8R02_00140 [Anaerohalosphaeraceae bacterium]|nr:hypothetical protein [Anaerohalosphaeraceae bacterium]